MRRLVEITKVKHTYGLLPSKIPVNRYKYYIQNLMDYLHKTLAECNKLPKKFETKDFALKEEDFLYEHLVRYVRFYDDKRRKCFFRLENDYAYVTIESATNMIDILAEDLKVDYYDLDISYSVIDPAWHRTPAGTFYIPPTRRADKECDRLYYEQLKEYDKLLERYLRDKGFTSSFSLFYKPTDYRKDPDIRLSLRRNNSCISFSSNKPVWDLFNQFYTDCIDTNGLPEDFQSVVTKKKV